jgi:uncharacterized protein
MSRFGLFILLLFVLSSVVPAGAQGAAEEIPLRITEVYYRTAGNDSEEEWIEIANLGTAVFDLSDISLGDEETIGGREGMVRFPAGAQIGPGQAVVVAQTAVAFQRRFGFTPDYEIQDSDPAVPDMRPDRLWSGGEIALANDGDELLLLYQNALIDAINYGDSATYFQPAINGVLAGQSIERVPADCDTDSAADWLPRPNPTPGELSFAGECLAPAPPAPDALPPIGQIQGRGEFSPYVNQIVTFRGVVTGFSADRNTQGTTYYTLFVQDPPGLEDGDPATSDGMVVFTGRQRPALELGDQVRITGLVTEFFGLTELDDDGLEIALEASGVPLPEPIVIDPPTDNAAQAAYFEALEGMRVTFGGEVQVVGPTYSGCGFAVSRLERPLRTIRQRAEEGIGHIVPVLHTNDVNCDGFPNVKVGDRVDGLVGPLTYHFDQFKLVQQAAEAVRITAVPLPPLPNPPIAQPGQFSIASLNMENHFDALDDTGSDAEPKPSPAEIGLKQTKLAAAISQALGCPTLLAVQEVEKESLLLNLAEALAEACGFRYEVSHRDSPDARGIDLALLSDPRRAQVETVALRQGCTQLNTGIRDGTAVCPTNQSPLFSRPPFQVDLRLDGQPLTVYVNHFKSKRGGEQETTAERLAQAAHINQLVEEKLAEDEQARLIVIGDFNDYELSPTMLAMVGNGRLQNVLAQIPLEQRYSYNFGGAAQLIDGILVSPALAETLAVATIIHSNADYPDSLGNDTSPAHLPYKSTDHDLSLAIFGLAEVAEMRTAAPVGRWWLWLAGGVGTAVLLTILVARRRQPG